MFETLFGTEGVSKSASVSSCGMYRYKLARVWDPSKPAIGWIMLNPSIADALTDDPTVRRCMGFAREWDYGGIEIRNLFAFRATNPDEMRKIVFDPIGPDNDAAILELARLPLVVVAWGVHGRDRARAVYQLLTENGITVHCLQRTKDGSPKHPLFANGQLLPKAYAMKEWPDGTNFQRNDVLLDDKAGSNPEEWPELIRVREFPACV